jgi:hypothetical protein
MEEVHDKITGEKKSMEILQYESCYRCAEFTKTIKSNKSIHTVPVVLRRIPARLLELIISKHSQILKISHRLVSH